MPFCKFADMKEIYIRHIAEAMALKPWQIENCADMLAEGDTVPFISRYRKEKTGSMDDAEVAEVKHWVDVFDEMEKRKATMLKTISEAGALTDALREAIEKCVDSTELEDIYLPYRPKRRTRATVAKELGLEPLADLIWNGKTGNPEAEARKYVKGSQAMAAAGKPGAEDVESALAGARDIIAERLHINTLGLFNRPCSKVKIPLHVYLSICLPLCLSFPFLFPKMDIDHVPRSDAFLILAHHKVAVRAAYRRDHTRSSKDRDRFRDISLAQFNKLESHAPRS